MSKSATILCLNGRRRKVKFTENTTVSQILEDLCATEKLDPTLHELRTQKSTLDKSLPWRYTNLPNNAKLELHMSVQETQDETPNLVRIAFQIDTGKRLTGEFSTATLLSDIVKHFSKDLNSLLPHPSGSVPTVIYMRQNLVGEKVLSTTSLRMLGIIKGSALLRFSYKHLSSTDEPSEPSDSKCAVKPDSRVSKDATKSKTNTISTQDINSRNPNDCDIHREENSGSRYNTSTSVPNVAMNLKHSKVHHDSLKTKSADTIKPLDDDVASTSSSKIVNSDSTSAKRLKQTIKKSVSSEHYDLSNFSFPVSTQGEQLYMVTDSIDDGELSKPCPRQSMMFDENSSNSKNNAKSKEDESDDFFEVTVDDLRKMMADLKHERSKFEEKDLLTETQRKSRKLQLVSRHPHIVVRVLFPNRMVLQGVFKPLETMESLYKFVQEHVTISPFHLFTSPPKRTLKNDTTSLYDNNLAPASRVYFGCTSNLKIENIIKKTAFELLCSREDANLALRKCYEL